MKILVVDDHILVREGICYVLGKLENNTNTVEADNYQQAVRQLNIHIILIDLKLPGENGFTLFQFCRTSYPSIAAVLLTASKQRTNMQRYQAEKHDLICCGWSG